FERLVAAARREKLAGATVLRGILGAGYHGILRPSAWSLAEHVPVIVEIVDGAERIARFVHDTLDGILVGGMVTLERAAVAMYRGGRRGAGAVARQPPEQGGPAVRLPELLKPLSTLPQIQPGPHMKVN